MAFNWLLKQHRSQAANMKRRKKKKKSVFTFNAALTLQSFGSRNRWLKNIKKKKTFLFIQYAFKVLVLLIFSIFFLFSNLFVVFIYIVWSLRRRLWWRNYERARITGRTIWYCFTAFLLLIFLLFFIKYFLRRVSFFFVGQENNYSMSFDSFYVFFCSFACHQFLGVLTIEMGSWNNTKAHTELRCGKKVRNLPAKVSLKHHISD